jgi:crotonobetainyl-CoA:carnitine CoA-transferase CaiB-like acyl-CoA transferase
MMALLVQRQTGRGQYVDAALYESAFSFMEPHIPAYEKLGHVAGRAGPRLPDNTPNNLYPTRDGGFIHIAAIGEPVFRRFLAVMGRPKLIEDPRFRTAVDRAKNDDALDALIADWTQTHDLETLEGKLLKADVPAARIFTMADIFRDPHYAARGAIVDAPDGELGSVKMANVVPRLSETPGRVRHAGGGRVGVDTRAVLQAIAGLSATEISALAATGVIACADSEEAISHVS